MRDVKEGETLQKLAETHRILVAQFGSASCTPCTAIKQKIEEWLHRHPDIGGVYLSIDKFPQEAAQAGVFSVPTILAYVEGKPTVRESGYFSLESIFRQLERYCTLLNEEE